MSDGLFFVGILLFFFLLWFVSGGPTRPISFAGPYITPVHDVGDEQEGYGTTDGWLNFNTNIGGGGFGIGGGYQNQEQAVRNAESELARLEGQAAELAAFGSPSPYRDQVEIVSVRPSEDEAMEYVTIRLSSSATAPIAISGWRLYSNATGKSAVIPYGTELPRSGFNSLGVITLKPGEEALLTTGSSPIGTSFRENMCVGYFAERDRFNPSLWSSCPAPLDEFDRYYQGNKLDDDECYYYLQSQSSCTNVPTKSDLSNACRALIDTYLDYSGCVTAHRYESRFVDDTWRIYLERGSSLWKPSRDAVKLLDQNGLTVDLYTY